MKFSKVDRYTSIRPGVGVGSATVNDIRVLKYTRKVMYRTSHPGSEEEMSQPRKAYETGVGGVTPLYKHQLPPEKNPASAAGIDGNAVLFP